MAERSATFEGWRYTHYYETVYTKGHKYVMVKCKLCPGQKLLFTAVNTTPNLSKNLQRQHANMNLAAEDLRRQMMLMLSVCQHQPTNQSWIFNRQKKSNEMAFLFCALGWFSPTLVLALWYFIQRS